MKLWIEDELMSSGLYNGFQKRGLIFGIIGFKDPKSTASFSRLPSFGDPVKAAKARDIKVTECAHAECSVMERVKEVIESRTKAKKRSFVIESAPLNLFARPAAGFSLN